WISAGSARRRALTPGVPTTSPTKKIRMAARSPLSPRQGDAEAETGLRIAWVVAGPRGAATAGADRTPAATPLYAEAVGVFRRPPLGPRGRAAFPPAPAGPWRGLPAKYPPPNQPAPPPQPGPCPSSSRNGWGG